MTNMGMLIKVLGLCLVAVAMAEFENPSSLMFHDLEAEEWVLMELEFHDDELILLERSNPNHNKAYVANYMIHDFNKHKLAIKNVAKGACYIVEFMMEDNSTFRTPEDYWRVKALYQDTNVIHFVNTPPKQPLKALLPALTLKELKSYGPRIYQACKDVPTMHAYYASEADVDNSVRRFARYASSIEKRMSCCDRAFIVY